MCGLTGFLALGDHRPGESVLQAMTEALAHRGPDGEGTYLEGPVGLGHRRLAVIDVRALADQPYISPCGRYVGVYNGELYNFWELRAELEKEGVTFQTRSDTEAFFQALIHWGDEAIERFNGMFAYALWDKAEQCLSMGRDRYGIKPLYYLNQDGVFYFSSEIKSFLKTESYSADVEPQALFQYFTFQNVLDDRTLFSGVHVLQPGTQAFIHPGDAELRLRRYWQIDFSDRLGHLSEQDQQSRLTELFVQAVERQLLSDVDLGTYLSGGLDSGGISAIAARQIDPLVTITGGFDLTSVSGIELGFDERPEAEAQSYFIGSEHYEVVMKAGDLERVFPRLVWHLEDLRVGQCYPNFFAAKLASKFMKVSLAGTGGDELFAGYPWRYRAAREHDAGRDFAQEYYSVWQRLVPKEQVGGFFHQRLRNQVSEDALFDAFKQTLTQGGPVGEDHDERVNACLFFEWSSFLHGLLIVEDRLSMAHGLEVRLPFLDNDLVDFASALPVSAKLRNLAVEESMDENEAGPKKEIFFEKTKDGKLILRNVLEGILPPSSIKRPKKGFSGPDATWFRGQSMDYVKRLLLGRDALCFSFLDRATVHSLVQEHLSGQVNRRLLLWSLMSFELWCQIFLEGRDPHSLSEGRAQP
ncbi:MAG: asparagine synthase (glutamine-hydrolyzing) [Magnetovibrionaceae bacterium]